METEIAGISLKTPIYNASGARCTTDLELNDLLESNAGAVLTKSCTMEYREGNEKPRYWGYHDHDRFNLSINSTGLHNMGYKYYVNQAKNITGKPYIISVAGLSYEEKLQILKNIDKDIGSSKETSPTNISGIELNISCPNLKKNEVSNEEANISELLRKIYEFWDNKPIPIGLKMPPFLDLKEIEVMADYISAFPTGFVTCINSLGNGLVIDNETEMAVIKPRWGHGGIGGSSILPIALANVRHFYKSLNNDHISVIGCGGVTTGQEVFSHILAGASAVQVGTQLMIEGPKCFNRLNSELSMIMKEKGYKDLNDFRGKLKNL